MNWRDDIKAMLASVGGMGVQFADIDALIKLTIGVLTIAYLSMKIYHLAKGQKDE